jgi:hypothetical protein
MLPCNIRCQLDKLLDAADKLLAAADRLLAAGGNENVGLKSLAASLLHANVGSTIANDGMKSCLLHTNT